MQKIVKDEVRIPFYKSTLKSAVQKAIRRGEVEKAIRCTKSFLELDELDCLRRSMIWPIEDVILHPAYDELAKLTDKLSRKGSVPLTEKEKSKVLSLVGDFARCGWRDLDVGNVDDEGEAYAMQPVKGGRENDLVNALLFRQRIGAGYWDKTMLAQMARVWNKRFAQGSWTAEKLKQYYTGENIAWNDIPYATVADIPVETIDFHCSPINTILLKKDSVKELLKSEIPFNRRDFLGSDMSNGNLLETIMWTMRSGINYKKNIWYEDHGAVDWRNADKVPKNYWPVFEKIYDQIKQETDNIAEWYLNKQLERK